MTYIVSSVAFPFPDVFFIPRNTETVVLTRGRPGMTYITRDWWQKKSVNSVLDASVIINFYQL